MEGLNGQGPKLREGDVVRIMQVEMATMFAKQGEQVQQAMAHVQQVLNTSNAVGTNAIQLEKLQRELATNPNLSEGTKQDLQKAIDESSTALSAALGRLVQLGPASLGGAMHVQEVGQLLAALSSVADVSSRYELTNALLSRNPSGERLKRLQAQKQHDNLALRAGRLLLGDLVNRAADAMAEARTDSITASAQAQVAAQQQAAANEAPTIVLPDERVEEPAANDDQAAAKMEDLTGAQPAEADPPAANPANQEASNADSNE